MVTVHKWERYLAHYRYGTSAIYWVKGIYIDHVRSLDRNAYPDDNRYPESDNINDACYWYVYAGTEEVSNSAVHKWEKYALDGDIFLDYFYEVGSVKLSSGDSIMILPEPHIIDSRYGRIISDNSIVVTLEQLAANTDSCRDALDASRWFCVWSSGNDNYWYNTFKAYYCAEGSVGSDKATLYYTAVVEFVSFGKGTYIETVESDDPSTYRENGRQDGYWYVYIGAEGGEEANHHLYATVDGVQQELTKLPAMIDGVKVNLSELYATVDGVQRLVFSDPDAGTSAQPIVEKQNGVLVTVDSYSPANVLSYIQTDGNQFVDTEFQPNQNTKVVMDFQATNMNVHIFGARKAWLSDEFVLYWSEDGAFAAQVNDSANNIDGSFTDANRHVAVLTGTSLTIDGTVAVTYDGGTFSTENNLLLASSTNSQTSENMQGKIYASEVYDNGTMILNYVPYKLSDGRVGLLDKVNYRFYPNAGTGTFTGG